MLSRILRGTLVALALASLTSGCFWHHRHHRYRVDVQATQTDDARVAFLP